MEQEVDFTIKKMSDITPNLCEEMAKWVIDEKIKSPKNIISRDIEVRYDEKIVVLRVNGMKDFQVFKTTLQDPNGFTGLVRFETPSEAIEALKKIIADS